ncbi:hypothetical protein ACFX1X_041956 [Malus domestica]
MERTPFWDLFKTYREGIATNDAWKNDYDVIDILETYNKDLKCFDIGGKRLTITAIDIAAIFGLKVPTTNSQFHFSYKQIKH